MKKKLISFAIPCFNEEENISRTYQALKAEAKRHARYAFEYVFVDNGSTDKSRAMIRTLAQKDKTVVAVFLSRNFGPEASLQATLDMSSGDAVLPFDCDLQDPPELTGRYIEKWEQGYDIVVGVRPTLEGNPLMNFVRKSYYRIFKAISNINIPINAGGSSLMSRKVINAIKALPEKYRFQRGIRAWVGFSTAYITYHRRKRQHGKSSTSLWSYLELTQRSFFGFSYLQLNVVVYLGFFLVVFMFFAFTLYLSYILSMHIPINASIIITGMIVFFGGIELLAISVVGKYIQVILEETKARPLYIVEDAINVSTKLQ